MPTSNASACNVDDKAQSETCSATQDTLAGNPRKRKSPIDADSRQNKRLLKAFAIRGNTHDGLIAKPHLLLSRGQLPLAYVATSCHVGARSIPRYLRLGERKLKDALCAHKASHDAKLAIVSFGSEKSLYALEHVQEDVYAVCPLHESITIDHLRRAKPTSNAILDRSKVDLPKSFSSGNWWSHIALNPESRIVGNNVSRREGNILQQRDALVQAPTRADVPSKVICEKQPASESTSANLSLLNDKPSPQSRSESFADVKKSLIQHYLEALYCSKSSLAYFSKGPLSRARVEASVPRTGDDASKGLSLLATALESMILKSSLLDKKYRDQLSLVIKSQAVPDANTENTNPSVEVKEHRKRKSRSLKPDKNGLYVMEAGYVAKWWYQENELASGHEQAPNIGQSLSRLKTREGLLQLLLLLEIAAIERDRAFVNVNDDGEESSTGVCQTVEGSVGNDTTSKKHSPSEHARVDMLVDRLCIWQSVGAETSSTSKHKEKTSPRDIEGMKSPRDSKSPDQLKSFCIDVLLPLYASRVPHTVRHIASKMGVAFDAPPSEGSFTSSHRAKPLPGMKIERQRPSEIKSLAHSSSKGWVNTSRKPPSLLRSATDSQLQGLKRENSASPLSPGLLLSHRKTLTRSNSTVQPNQLASREIDMNAIARYNEVRTRTKADTEKELKAAIAALKRPNRDLAVKDYAVAVEQTRSATNTGATRVRKVLRRQPMPVEVDATPKRDKSNRHSQMGDCEKVAAISPTTKESLVPSTMPLVPSSSVKSRRLTSYVEPFSLTKTAMPPPTFLQTPPRSTSRAGLPIEASRVQCQLKDITGPDTIDALFDPDQINSAATPSTMPFCKSAAIRDDACSIPLAFVPASSPPGPDSRRTPFGPKSQNMKSVPAQTSEFLNTSSSWLKSGISNDSNKGKLDDEINESIYDALGWD